MCYIESIILKIYEYKDFIYFFNYILRTKLYIFLKNYIYYTNLVCLEK